MLISRKWVQNEEWSNQVNKPKTNKWEERFEGIGKKSVPKVKRNRNGRH